MTVEEALARLDVRLHPAHLNDIQVQIFQACWAGETYAIMAERLGYDVGYIKDTGAKLWQLLSSTLGEKVSKSNLHAVFERELRSQLFPTAPSTGSSPANASLAAASPTLPLLADSVAVEPSNLDKKRTDPIASWGEAIDVTVFFGREVELARLQDWITRDRCRCISILGIGGIGKTSVSVRLAQSMVDSVNASLAEPFQAIVWRTLRNAPPVTVLMTEIIQILAGDRLSPSSLPSDAAACITLLMELLQAQRCLLVLDNVETILQSGEYSGHYRPEHAGYRELFSRLAQTPHASCLVLTSRENPRELTALEGETLPVRSLRLSGLTENHAQSILQTKGRFVGTPDEWQTLSDRYAGNPLALKVVAATIQELFEGKLGEFLAQGATVFDDIRTLLQQQFERLSRLEQSLMYGLAIAREPIRVTELHNSLNTSVTKTKLLDAVSSLRRRSLIEKTGENYTQQPVLMEYVTDRLIAQISQELLEITELQQFHAYPILQATAKDYIRQQQTRMIVEPLLANLKQVWRSPTDIKQQVLKLLDYIQANFQNSPGYAGGNLLNLINALNLDPAGYDFSGLALWQAQLQQTQLHHANFSGTDLSHVVFAQTLGSILAVAFSPNGEQLATSDGDGEVRLWQVQDGKQCFAGREHASWVKSIAFSPDGQTLASSGEDRVIRLWDVGTGQSFQDFSGHSHWVWAIAFSPIGRRLGSASQDQTVRLWDLSTGDCVQVLAGHEGGVCAIAFAPDGRLATGGEDQTVRLWEAETGTLLKVLSGHQQRLRSIAFSPDGQWLASGSDDGQVHLWDAQTGELRQSWLSDRRLWSLAFHPSATGAETLLATAGDEQVIKLWRWSTGDSLTSLPANPGSGPPLPMTTLSGHGSKVWSVAFSPDGETLASGSDDQTIKLWDWASGRCIRTLQGYRNLIWSVVWNAEGTEVISGSEDGQIRSWQVSADRYDEISAHTGRVWTVAASPKGELIASGGDDRTLRIWQSGSGRCLKSLPEREPVRQVLFSPNGCLLASNSSDSTIKLWEVSQLYSTPLDASAARSTAAMPRLRSLQGHRGRVYAIAFHPHSTHLISGGEDRTIRLWDVQTGACLRSFTGHDRYVFTVAYSPVIPSQIGSTVNLNSDSAVHPAVDPTIHPDVHPAEYIASGSDDQTIRLWNVTTGDCVRVMTGHQGWVQAIAFSPDGSLLASASTDLKIKLWDVQTGRCLNTLEGHSKGINSLSFSPDGTMLVSGSEDETLKLWQIATSDCWKTLRANRLYEGLNITAAKGLTDAQKSTLKLLGAIED